MSDDKWDESYHSINHFIKKVEELDMDVKATNESLGTHYNRIEELEKEIEAYRSYQNNCSYTDNMKEKVEMLLTRFKIFIDDPIDRKTDLSRKNDVIKYCKDCKIANDCMYYDDTQEWKQCVYQIEMLNEKDSETKPPEPIELDCYGCGKTMKNEHWWCRQCIKDVEKSSERRYKELIAEIIDCYKLYNKIIKKVEEDEDYDTVFGALANDIRIDKKKWEARLK